MKKNTQNLFRIISSFSMLTLLVSAASFAAPHAAVNGEYLIRMKGELRSNSRLSDLHRSLGVSVRTPFKTFSQFQVVAIPAERRLNEASIVASYRQSSLIEYIEPNYLYHTSQVANETDSAREYPLDPEYAQQWGLRNIDALGAWGVSNSLTRPVVAVIDTGVDYTHPDLAANAWKNPGESGTYTDAQGNLKDRATDGIDNDGNGFIDDVQGWNFHDNSNDPNDNMGHGSHCAGIIAGAHNGVGIMGVAPTAQIMAVKFLGAGGDGTLENGILATEYAMIMKANVLSNSWGGDGYSKAFAEVISEVTKRGILYVAAAGNEHNHNDTEPTYPASYPIKGVVSVGATDETDSETVFTNWGTKSVHLTAPGFHIYSAFKEGEYKLMSGTSMACPHVAGAAALLWSNEPGLSNFQVAERLVSSVDHRYALQGRYSSGGRLNVLNLLQNKSTPLVESDPEGWKFYAFRAESPHPYPSLANIKSLVSHQGAKQIKLHFKLLQTAEQMDGIILRDSRKKTRETLNRNQGSLWSRPVEGSEIEVNLRSDSANQSFGYEIDGYSVIE